MTLAERYVLLALDPLRGKPAAGVRADSLRRGTSAAILVELVLHRRIAVANEEVTVAAALPDFHPLLGEAVPLLARGAVPIPVGEALSRIERGIPKIVARVLDSLVARDLLHHYRQAFVFHTHPLRSRQALDEVFAALHRVLDGTASRAELAFAALVDCCGVGAARLPSETQFLLRRALAVVEQQPNAPEEFAEIRAITRAADETA
ncbi:MAG TPA: GPP34 family phosphoprotein [Candidatus Saccharimonadia bacterium]|nr:GPP34 family phosphoprotein [Candidatus Saccharimonadia bacterium]